MAVSYNREALASITFEPDLNSPSTLAADDDASRYHLQRPHTVRNNAGASPQTLTPQANGWREEASGAVRHEASSLGKKPPVREPNIATRNIIHCMKLALVRSISSISHPEKQRPLDPRKDFTIESTLTFEVEDTDFSCCGASATRIKKTNPFRESARSTPWYMQQQKVHVSRGDDEAGNHSSSAANRSGEPYHSSDDDDDDVSEVRPPVPFRFTDYSPMCYRHIREFLKINPKEYQDVLCQSRWHSIPTPGKSAAQLFFCGQNWVIKTMTDQESHFLRDILHRYYYHIRDNPYSLLPHFVGHHRLSIGSESLNIVIMQNVFATTNTIHEKYDLKGSTVGRFATRKEKMKQTCTQKDLDINHPVHIGAARRALLIEQLRKDCDFLKRSMIMDYSFLVGIHILPKNLLNPPKHALPTSAAWGTSSFVAPGATSGHLGSMAAATMTFNAASNSTFGNSMSIMEGESPFGSQNHNPQAGYSITPGGASGSTSAIHGHLNSTTAHYQLEAAPGSSGGNQIAQPPLDGRCFTADEGGMRSTDEPFLRQEIYYVGIIDILQEYNLWKRTETFLIGMTQDRDRISSVHPSDYANRFIAFMSSIIV